MTKPILVVMSWRGGDRLHRCLGSIAPAAQYFDRILVSVTSTPDSTDNALAQQFAASIDHAESLCTGRELPTMEHQTYWVDYLESTGMRPDAWVFWLAYDDEVRLRGLQTITDVEGNWPITLDTSYIGPWAMRHEDPEKLFDGDLQAPLESWTSFPTDVPLRLPVASWIGEQLRQPTYMQMSGSVIPFANYQALRDRRPRKTGPMRIEMATAAGPRTSYVEEFAEPVSIIYGRSNSDRASYGQGARREDFHLAATLARRWARHPQEIAPMMGALGSTGAAYARVALGRGRLPAEEWRVRGHVAP